MSDLYRACDADGGMTGYVWRDDPKRLLFTLSRYKFVAKMFAGKDHVLEVGCADGFGSRIVRQHVDNLVGVDIDAVAIAQAKKNNSKEWPIFFEVANVLSNDFNQELANAVYALDVFEHIPHVLSSKFCRRLYALAPVAIIGIPSLESQQYASELSRKGHVNCMSGDAFKAQLQQHWPQVFLFSMNDEVVHTGFYPMAHYLFALCVR